MNSIHLIGNLGADPQYRQTPSGNPVCNFSIAVDRRYYKIDESGNKRLHRETDWIPVVTWNNLATTCKNYLQKGSKISVQGSLRPREYIDKTGNKRSTIEVKGEGIGFLDKIKGNNISPES